MPLTTTNLVDSDIPTLPSELLDKLLRIVGPDGLLTDPEERLVYECDAYTVEKALPGAVVFPESTEQVSAIVRLCNEFEVPFVPRGAGTGLAGGALPLDGALLISLTRLRRIVEVNLRDRYAIVEAGVVNSELNRYLKGSGYHYAPDPSSQGACTLGGNVATNAGGPHTLKYGVTANHVLGLEVVLPDGAVVQLGGVTEPLSEYDLTGLFVGSEGTLGICTKAIVRLTRDPVAYRTLLAIFNTVRDASRCISSIIAAGIIPAAMEMMDGEFIRVVEDAYHFGFPPETGAVALIEVDGLEAAVDAEAERIERLCHQHGAREIRRAHTEEERQLLWRCRKQAFGAIGRFGSSFCTQDGVVPRTRLPDVLDFIADCSRRYGVRIVNVFHAGDGNIHPILLFDDRDREQVDRAVQASKAILAKCVELGGTVTGEHGIGVEKLQFMSSLFSQDDLQVMAAIKAVFDPRGLCTPKKAILS